MTTPIDNMTFGQIEQLLLTFMNNNGINYTVGSPEFTNYIFEQALGDTDPKLKNDENYFAFTAYFARYICALDEQQTYDVDMSTNFSTDSFKDITVKQIRDKVLAEDAALAQTEQTQLDNSIAPLTYPGYDPSYAVSYAYDWVYGRNSIYPNYAEDCTNFVSQCLAAGGCPEQKPAAMPTGIYETSSYWYCDIDIDGSDWNLSTPWLRVSNDYNFHDYWAPKVPDANYAGDTTVSANADVGDVVQIRNAGTLERFHTTIVTKFVNGTACLTYHSTDTKDKPISELDDYAYDWSLLDFAD